MRLLDLSLSIAGLIALAPLLIILALLVRCTGPGPIFYRARRVGRQGRVFSLYKYRTMVEGADKSGPGVTGRKDPRITPIGRYLRRAKLDELPQLFNVLKGDMSLVGPRPEDPRYVRHYGPDQRRLLDWKPGITSPATALFHDESRLLGGVGWEERYLRDILPRKLEIELNYFPRRTLAGDLSVVLRTLAVLVRSRGRSLKQAIAPGEGPRPESQVPPAAEEMIKLEERSG